MMDLGPVRSGPGTRPGPVNLCLGSTRTSEWGRLVLSARWREVLGRDLSHMGENALRACLGQGQGLFQEPASPGHKRGVQLTGSEGEQSLDLAGSG